MRVPAWLGSGESPLLECRVLADFSLYPQDRKDKKALGGPIYEGTNPIH